MDGIKDRFELEIVQDTMQPGILWGLLQLSFD